MKRPKKTFAGYIEAVFTTVVIITVLFILCNGFMLLTLLSSIEVSK